MGLSNLTKKFLICAFSLCTVSSFAQEVKEEGKVVFNPHWFMQIQGGASHTLGEASFSDLISPAAQVTGGYQFSPLFGLRAGVSAWEAKGAWASPSRGMSWHRVCQLPMRLAGKKIETPQQSKLLWRVSSGLRRTTCNVELSLGLPWISTVVSPPYTSSLRH